MTDESFISSYVVDEDILVVKLHGKLDNATTQEFRDELDKHFDAGMHKMIIDCAHLGYVSSAGVSALIRLQHRLQDKGGEVKLAAIQTVVSDVLRITKLEQLLNIYGDIEFARESFYDE